MNEVTWQQVVWLITAIGTAISFLLLKPTVESIIKLGNWWGATRKQRLEMELEHQERLAKIRREDEDRRLQQQAVDEELNDRGHKARIRSQDRRITNLEAEVREIRQHERNCAQELAGVKADNRNLEEKYNQVVERLEETEKQLADARTKLDLLAPGLSSLDVSDSRFKRYIELATRSRERRERKKEASSESESDSPDSE